MNFKHVIIVTYGRSGSTLLQGVLNSIDGLLIKGENFNFCYGLYQSFSALKDLTQKGIQTESVTRPFYGAREFNEKEFLIDAYKLLEKQVATSKIKVKAWGFKEIRYLPSHISVNGEYELKAYLDFLNKLLPECGVVFLTRNHESVMSSAFWKSIPNEKIHNNLIKFEEEASDWCSHKNNTYWVNYSNIVTKRLEGLYDFLGVEYVEEDIEKLLSVEYSYGNKK